MAESKQQREVLARQAVTVQFDLGAGDTHGDMNLAGIVFQPDEVIVRSVTYSTLDPNADWAPISLWSSLVGNFLCSFAGNGTSCPQTKFPVKVAVSGNFAFAFVEDVVSKRLTSTGAGICVLTLEFVQHGPGRELD